MHYAVTKLIEIKAVLFDLHGSLAYMENPLSGEEISNYLFSRGYEFSPQQLKAAWMFVAFVDYPRYGYKSWCSYFSRILWRLKIKVNEETLNDVVQLLEKHEIYRLYPDAAETVINAKRNGLKTAIVTTIAYFQFKTAIQPIKKYFDFIMTGFEAGCDKTNPKMYQKTLQILKIKPEEAVVIGDNIDVDILLPKRLGMHAILLDRERRNIKCQAADAIANTLPQALELVLCKRLR